MAGLKPSIKKIDDIKHQLLQPALTSHFLCTIEIPAGFQNATLKDNGFILSNIKDTLSISCAEANLPGSSLATHELNNDFTGITQKHAYRRLYDDRADFTFYVNENYDQIRIFEAWIRYISGEQLAFGEANNVSYKVNYPKNYKAGAIYITKFERDYGIDKGSSRTMDYAFINAFPVSINSMPVSYDASSLLKVTVSFSYDRYIASNVKVESEPYATGVAGVPQSPFKTQQEYDGAVNRALNTLSGPGFGDAALERSFQSLNLQ